MTGFEPATSGTTIQRSNQLSYNHQFESGAKIRKYPVMKQVLCR